MTSGTLWDQGTSSPTRAPTADFGVCRPRDRPLAPVLRAAGLMTAAPARSVTVAVVPAGEPELEPGGSRGVRSGHPESASASASASISALVSRGPVSRERSSGQSRARVRDDGQFGMKVSAERR